MKEIKWTKIGDLEWSEDLGEMDWFEATKKCKELGGRLPTRTELIDLYDSHRKECEDFVASNNFWSSTETYGNPTRAWYVDLNYGHTHYDTKPTADYVRCVRTRDISPNN